jgi:hypothetical protein
MPEDTQETVTENQDNDTRFDTSDPDFQKIVASRVEAERAAEKAEFKARMDALDAKAKEAERKRIEAEETARRREIETLEKEGKAKEALEMKLTTAEEKLRIAEARLIEFTRDSKVTELLSEFEFRTPKMRDIAKSEIIKELVQSEDDHETWIHRSGAPLKDFVAKFAKDEDNAPFFKPKTNSGTGAQAGTANGVKQKKAVTEMTTQELLAAAAAGQLRP